ncbi:MAG: restriction endonuclease subunit S [Magnetococcales bacterium]|nr:restriction endonuclease subunit S [Magnetococcales bacterium]
MKTMKWDRKPLGTVADLCLGKMLDQNKNRGEPFPYLANVNVRWGVFELNNLRTMRFEPKEMDRYGLKFGDIVMCEGGEPGRCAIWKDQIFGMMIQKALHRIRPKALLDYRFLFYSFLHIGHSKGFDQYFTGATIKHLPGEKLAKVEVDIPPIPIQRRIAAILSAYDELIENNQRRITILETMARNLYREWFVHFRFPGHENHPRVSSALGEIPQGWEVKKLGEIAEEMRRNVPKGELDEPQPYVGLEHIPRRSLALDAWETTLELGSNKLEFKNGEVLFGKIRPYFHKVSIAPFDGLCSADTIIIRARHSAYYAFVVACVSSDAFVAEASATANGAKMPRANWGVLEKYKVIIPTGGVARQFSTLFTKILGQQQALIFQIQNLRRTRDLLLPRLLSGQIDVETLSHA